jgi:hypothetical protein
LADEQKIDLTKVQGFKDALQESLDETFSNITNMIKSGLAGNMKFSDTKEL